MYFGRTGNTPPVVKNLILINVVMYLGMIAIDSLFRVDMNRALGLYYYKSPFFQPYQIITHMFMHGSVGHIFFNMFAFWMFGKVLEQVWGSRRFLIYYFVTGLGAAFLHMLVFHIEHTSIIAQVSETYQIGNFTKEVIDRLYNTNDPVARKVAVSMVIPTVGASGAVFGILLAFGVLFPNTRLILLFPPIPIKAKYFVMGYGILELYLGLTQQGSNIAHFAHIGGMLFGYVLIRIWKSKRNTFY